MRDLDPRRIAEHPGLTVHIPFGLALYGMVASLLVGSHNWLNFLLWPVCAGLATVALGVGREGEPSSPRLLGAAVALSAFWGIWERGIRSRFRAAST